MLHSLFSDIRDEPLPPIVERVTFLGYAGLLPFMGAMAVMWMSPAIFDGGFSYRMTQWTLVYGAIVLSFMGGIHWGVALMLAQLEAREQTILDRLTGSVVPAILAWMAVIPDFIYGNFAVATVWRFGLLLAAFVYLLEADNRSVFLGVLPAWYGPLRQKLTFFLAMILLLIMVRQVQMTGF